MAKLSENSVFEMGLTQEKFAARLGVTFPTINRWENERAKPSPLAMEKIHLLLRQREDLSQTILSVSEFDKSFLR